ncbi:PP2C family protein-serine/threonine phosphatase [Streptomyces sp. 7N604]|uniref:PP2C family protein-serine/threonine phosphatase n=1 Tax=Streptomyces sp. 7N604 TaxID=3457415 RepID=UPI003FD6966F
MERVTTPEIDYAALFAATPSPYVVLGPDLVIVDVNRAYLEATGRTRGDLVGQYVFDAFPENPADPDADGVPNLKASLHRVLAQREPDTMALQKYDIPVAGRPSAFEERWWSPINTPVFGPDGGVAWIIVRVEDVTDFVRSRRLRQGPEAGDRGAEAELYARAQELQRLNEELRQANARERQVALTLQEAMLYSPDLPREGIAVRYLPATGTLNVCGDWYDVTDISAGEIPTGDAPTSRFAAAVGDVVGHGLGAAAVMGMMRSALTAAMRATDSPSRALQILGLYANSVEGALATTAVKVMIDTTTHLITYSSAGHLPPILVHADGSSDVLDQATDPPLATRSEHMPRREAKLPYTPGDALVLYTDGLIERRGEDIDAGIARLTDALSRYARLDPERLADALLARLGVSSGARDDIALVVIRL